VRVRGRKPTGWIEPCLFSRILMSIWFTPVPVSYQSDRRRQWPYWEMCHMPLPKKE